MAAPGSAAAFSRFYDRHAVAVVALARRLLRGGAEVDDVVQEAFLTAWRGADAYDAARGSERTWLLGIARHRAIDALRRRRAHEKRCAAVIRFHSGAADAEAASDELLRRLDQHQIQAAVARLPRAQREVVALGYYAGLSHTAIAHRINAPLGTVKGRMRLGLQQLSRDPRVALERSFEDGDRP